MSDPVPVRAAADVLADALRARKEHLRKHEFNVNCDTDEEVARLALAALASVCGDGPIVIMQDGTLWGVLPRDGGPKAYEHFKAKYLRPVEVDS
jgi:hypothetical protein